MELTLEFRNPTQREYYWSRCRNNIFSGGFGNGKSYMGCMRAVTFLTSFPGYRMVIARWTYASLISTTRQTFYKIIPRNSPLIARDVEDVTEFINGSMIYWKHLDNADENNLRGLEVNSVLVDQAEEISEAIYLVLSARVGRWDKAVPSDDLLKEMPDWPKNKYGQYIIPNYLDLLVNPDTTTHWVYRRFHPDSPTRDNTCGWFHGETDPDMNDPKTYAEMATRDPEWVNKYMKGIWGASDSSIHSISDMSYLDYDEAFLRTVIANGALYRAMDHGDTAPTCCLWVASYKGVYVFYREYYVANQVISYHRQAISDLTTPQEHILTSWADPSLFHKQGQKNGGFWTLADEYLTGDLSAPPIAWIAADNNEFATRNRINELLAKRDIYKHPVTGESPAPGIYFIRKSAEYLYGCKYVIEQTLAQKKKLVDTVNGKALYGDERDDKITDHGYDPLRYFIAQHSVGRAQKAELPGPGTIGHKMRMFDKWKRRKGALVTT